MSAHLVLGLLATVVVGAAGLAVPSLLAALPPHVEREGDRPADEAPPPTYAEVAARAHLRWIAVGWCLLAAALVTWRVQPGWAWAYVLPVVPVLVALALVDARTRLLPSRLVLPATAAVLGLAVVEGLARGWDGGPLRAVLTMLVARAAFWLLWRLHSAGLGFGDVRLSALLGLVLGRLGVAEAVVGLYAGFLLFAVPSALWALVRRDRSILRRAYPFGPALVAGALVGVVAGPLFGG